MRRRSGAGGRRQRRAGCVRGRGARGAEEARREREEVAFLAGVEENCSRSRCARDRRRLKPSRASSASAWRDAEQGRRRQPGHIPREAERGARGADGGDAGRYQHRCRWRQRSMRCRWGCRRWLRERIQPRRRSTSARTRCASYDNAPRVAGDACPGNERAISMSTRRRDSSWMSDRRVRKVDRGRINRTQAIWV